MKRAFTLVELLVVMAIIGALAAIVILEVDSARTKSRDSRRMADLTNLSKALDMYYVDNKAYPIPAGNGTTDGNWENSTSCLSNYDCWKGLLSSQYIAPMPRDPIEVDHESACVDNADQSKLYTYYTNKSDAYIVATRLELPNASDPRSFSGTEGCTEFANWAIKKGL